MVRLKVHNGVQGIDPTGKFQFQYGAIEGYGFESYNVIKTDFNSSMVRLKVLLCHDL